MPKVALKNVQLTVEESKVKEFLALGYSLIDNDGKIIKTGQATDLKSIKAENETLKSELLKYKDIDLEEVKNFREQKEALEVEITTLKAGNDALNSKIEKLEKANEKLKAENEKLKASDK